jgi:hypothetical protein
MCEHFFLALLLTVNNVQSGLATVYKSLTAPLNRHYAYFMTMPKPTMPTPSPITPVTEEQSGLLTENEQDFILNATLTPKSRKDATTLEFISEFVRHKSVAQAAEALGIKYSVAYNIRMRSDVATAIQKIIDKSVIKYGFDASEIIERTKEIVDFDPISMQNADGTFKSNMADIEPAARRNLKKLKVKNIWNEIEDRNGMKTKIIVGEVIEYEFYDKLKAIELTGKEKELFKNRSVVEHDVTKDMANVLLAAAKRGSDAAAAVTYKKPDVVYVDSEVVDDSQET